MAVVDLVDEMHEAPRRIFVARIEPRHVGDEDGVEIARDLDVVGGRARAFAQGGEIEPGQAVGHGPHGDVAVVDAQRAGGSRGGPGEQVELRRQRRFARFAQRRVIGAGLAQLAQAVILRAFEPEHRAMVFQQGDGGKETGALQAVAVELGRRDVRGRDQADAAADQLIEQAAQDHRIADVADEEFVEQQQSHVGGQFLRDHRQGVGGIGQRAQARMHLAHEAMEMPAPLRHRHAVEQQVGQEGLAAPDAAPQVQAAHGFGVAETRGEFFPRGRR